MAKVNCSFSLDHKEDADLLRLLSGCGNRSAFIRDALRAYAGSVVVENVTNEDIYQLLLEIREQGIQVTAVNQDVIRRANEPDNISQRLDSWVSCNVYGQGVDEWM